MLDHNDKEILLDSAGYKQFIDELEKLKLKSLSIAASGSESYTNAVGDGWHDNFDFEESMRESRTIANRINKLLLEKEKIKVIEKEYLDKEIVNIDDIVKIEIIYSEDDIETEIITLTGKYISNLEDEITINSPIGRGIFKKKIGTTVNCKVNDKVISVRIIEKIMNFV